MIAAIRLQQFRSYTDRRVELDPGVNIVVGPNASGKTNLLEAIMVICRGGSYRTSDNGLIMHNKNWARIDAQTNNGDRSLKLIKSGNHHKELILNNKRYLRITPNVQLPVVLFEPNHLLMLSGSPELRRAYLDEILDNTIPEYRKTRTDYLKTLRQRNSLLKSGSATADNLFPWNVRMSHLGGFIAAARTRLANEISKDLNHTYASISGKADKININYNTAVSVDAYESLILKKLQESVELDKLRGYTAHGPHREDLIFLINNKPPENVASRGENRSIVIALKVIEAEILNQKLNMTPIILLDDVLSELDNARRDAVVGLVPDRQILITTTDVDRARRQTRTNTIYLNNPTN